MIRTRITAQYALEAPVISAGIAFIAMPDPVSADTEHNRNIFALNFLMWP
jgi:hypothetical protein